MSQRPPDNKVSASDWEQTPPVVQARFRRLMRQRMWLQILTVGLLGLLAVGMWITASVTRPYMRVIRQNLEPGCIYRAPFDYVVQDGDTLFGLSLRYSVPVEAIASANGIANVHFLSIGVTINIPESFCVAPANLTRAVNIEITGTAFTLAEIATLTWEAINFTPVTHIPSFINEGCEQTLEALWQATQSLLPTQTFEAAATATAIIAFATHRAACREASNNDATLETRRPPTNFNFVDENCLQTLEAQWQATQAGQTPVPPADAPIATATAIILYATERVSCALTIEEYATRFAITPTVTPEKP